MNITYTAFNSNGSVDTTSKKSPITKRNHMPLRGHRFAHLHCLGSVTKETLPTWVAFLESCHGSMRVGAVALGAEPLRLSIHSESFTPGGYYVDFVCNEDDLGAVVNLLTALFR